MSYIQVNNLSIIEVLIEVFIKDYKFLINMVCKTDEGLICEVLIIYIICVIKMGIYDRCPLVFYMMVCYNDCPLSLSGMILTA